MFLLADFLACVRGGDIEEAAFAADGVAGTAAFLGLRASALDRDDVDWRSLHHPGSVVWPVVLALGADLGVPAERAAQAAWNGYCAAATIADALGADHRRTWHVTATAGTVGAAAAASVLLGLDASRRAVALRLAVTNVGGLSRAATERRGAAAFNRAAAVTLGIVAARGAAAGASAVDDPLTGAGGLLEAMGGAPHGAGVPVRDGLDDVAPRPLPTSGFLQGVAFGVARARSRLGGELVRLRVGLTGAVLPMVDGADAGPWWDARTTALRAWARAEAFLVDRPGPLDPRTDLVELVACDVPPGGAQVLAVTDRGRIEIHAGPMSLDDPGAQSLLERKWAEGPVRPDVDVLQLARSVLEGAVPLAYAMGQWRS